MRTRPCIPHLGILLILAIGAWPSNASAQGAAGSFRAPMRWSASAEIGLLRRRGAGLSISEGFDLTRRTAGRLSVSLNFNRVSADAWSPDHIGLETRASVIAPVAQLSLGSHARIGAGPLVAWTKTSTEYFSNERSKAVRPGAIVMAVGEVNVSTRLCMALSASYRWIAKADTGSFSATFGQLSVSYPRRRVDLSYVALSASLGVRF